MLNLQKMKRNVWMLTAAALLALGATGVAFADKGAAGKGAAGNDDRRAEHEQRRAEMLAKYDANKDGKLDEQERQQLRADMIAEEFTRLDVNKDGVLSKEEFSAVRPHHGHHGHGEGEHEGDKKTR